MNLRAVVAMLLSLVGLTGAHAGQAIVGYGKARLGMTESQFFAAQPPNSFSVGQCLFDREMIELGMVSKSIKIESIVRRCAQSHDNWEQYKFDPALTEIQISERRNVPPGEPACRSEMDKTARQIAQKYGQFDYEPRRYEADLSYDLADGPKTQHFIYLYTSVARDDRTIFLIAVLNEGTCDIAVDYSLSTGKRY